MADGSVGAPRGVTVAEALQADAVLVAACLSCGAEAVLDRPTASASLDRLADGLRCGCGARGGIITTRPFSGPRHAAARGLYLFVS